MSVKPTLTTLKTRVTESFKVAAPELKDFVFDYLSIVNDNNEFPLLLIPPPTANALGSTLEYEELNMEAWVYIPEHARPDAHWTAIADECKGYLRAVIMKLFEYRPDYILIGDVAFTNGHFEHNNMLAGSKATFKMRAYYGC